MNVVIRADGSNKLGNGHIWRTLKLANELRNREHNVSYISKHFAGAPFQKIEDEEFSLKKIAKDEDDVEKVLEWAKIKGARWILVDRYASQTEEYQRYRDEGYKVIALDDLCMTQFPVHILVNQQLWAKEFKYETADDTIKLLGPDYIMMDDVYFKKQNHYIINPPLKLFIFMGGGDIKDLTYKVTKVVLQRKVPMVIDILLSSGYKYKEKLKTHINCYASKMYHTVHIHENLPNLFDVAKGSRLAILGGGMAAFEMCSMGIPMIIIPQAPNQQLSAKYFEYYGVARSIINFPQNWQQSLRNFIFSFAEGPDVLMEAHQCAKRIIRGNGIPKIVQEMEDYE